MISYIILEEKDFAVICKPAGLLVHMARAGSKEATLVDWLLAKYPEIKTVGDDPGTRPGIVHRLDRDTSGVMVVARTKEYFGYLKSLFMERRIKKTYLAAAYGVPKEKRGTIDAPIALKPGTVKHTIHKGKMEKEAVTDYEVIVEGTADRNERIALLKVSPRTGRTHQIRVHLASIGHPIIGDRIYGAKKRSDHGANRLMLHALSLEFEASPGKRLNIAAEPPEDFLSALSRWGIPVTPED